jgi:hypothetical protein
VIVAALLILLERKGLGPNCFVNSAALLAQGMNLGVGKLDTAVVIVGVVGVDV